MKLWVSIRCHQGIKSDDDIIGLENNGWGVQIPGKEVLIQTSTLQSKIHIKLELKLVSFK